MIRKLALCIATTTLLAQASVNAAECKYEKNELDKFTKVKIIETEWERLSSAPGFFASFAAYASVRTKGDAKSLNIKFSTTEREKYRPRQYQLSNRFTIAAGAPLLLLMEDGSIVELQTAKGARTNAKYTDPKDMEGVDEFQIDAAGAVEYTLDEATIVALSAQDVTHIRMGGVTKYTNVYDKRFDISVREKMAGHIRNSLECSK